MKYAIILFSFVILSCANIVMPTGGAKDMYPPKVVSSFPSNNQTNFKGSEISLKFDEYIELESPQKNIYISPYTKQTIEHYIVGKKLFIYFPEGLKPNTTYTVQFNRAIKDFTEGNQLSEYSLNFSTGFVLDSGKYMTTVISTKDKSVNDMTVVALVKNKSDFYNKNYNYITKTTNGLASFNNLNKEGYLVYAFVDSNQNMKWEKTEPIAFSKNKVKEGNISEKLSLFTNKDTAMKLIATQKSPNEYDVYSPQEIMTVECDDINTNVHQVGLHSFKLICKNALDGQAIKLLINNSVKEVLIAKTETKKTIEIIDKENNRGFDLKRNDSLFFNFNAFISKIDTSKIKLKLEDKQIPLKINYTKNQLLITDLDFKQTYNLELDSQAIWSLGHYNKRLNFNFTTYPKESFYPEITIKLDTNIINQKAILYYSQNGFLSQLKINKEIRLKNIYGTELLFHIIIDKNNNGIWDTGDVEREIQPESYYIESIKLDAKKPYYDLKTTNP